MTAAEDGRDHGDMPDPGLRGALLHSPRKVLESRHA